jgi:long-chain acyl-CoA synthetase
MPPLDLLPLEQFQLLLQRQPADHPALLQFEGLTPVLRWTFADLRRESQAAERMLREQGVQPGDRIGVLVRDSPYCIALLLATLALDCCYLSLAPDAGSSLLGQMLAGSAAKLVVVDVWLPPPQLRLVLRQCRKVLRLRPQHPHWLRPLLVPHRRQAPQLVQAPLPVPQRAVLQLFSSGATGSPKAIVYTRTAFDTFLHWQQQLYAAFPDQPAPQPGAVRSPRINLLPLAHFGGLSFCLQALLEGRSVWLARAATPAEQLSLVRQSGCQLLLLVPALYEILLQEDAPDSTPWPLRYCLTMGEPLPPLLRKRLAARFRVPVVSAYGMSECLSGIGHHGPFMLDDVPEGSCGKLLFGAVKLLDPLTGAEGDSGELWVCNATTTPCYADPLLLRQRYHEGWYRTGDLFRRDPAGWYYCMGRADGLCIVNGCKVFPQQVEQLLLQHPHVLAAIAAPLQLNDGRQRLGALVCTTQDCSPVIAELLDHCVRGGPLHAVPAWITFCHALPTTGNGKPDRKAAGLLLAADYLQQHLQAG